MKHSYTIMLKGKYLLEYCGYAITINEKPGVNYDIEYVDGHRAGNMNSIAVGVNDEYILFKVTNYRHYATDVSWRLLNKATGEEKMHYERPKGLRFSRIKPEIEELIS